MSKYSNYAKCIKCENQTQHRSGLCGSCRIYNCRNCKVAVKITKMPQHSYCAKCYKKINQAQQGVYAI
jgi:hypothetical protein